MMASYCPHRSVQVCKKCQRPVRGHVGPTGSSCSQPSPQFLTDVPPSSSLLPANLANIQEELEADTTDPEHPHLPDVTSEIQLLNSFQVLSQSLYQDSTGLCIVY